jgi:DNA repair exonuclease SbcCD ATPase subunit
MRRKALDNLRAAIEANTQRCTLDELKARGKKHVRIVSGDKVMQIIKAIVSDIVDREVGELTQQDRERIVAETKQEFDRVVKMQADQDAMLQEQKDISKQYKAKFDAAQEEQQRLHGQIEEVRAEYAEREEKLRAESQARINELKDRLTSTEELVTEATQEKERLERMLEDERRQHGEHVERVKADYEARIETLMAEQKGLLARMKDEKGAAGARQEQALAKMQERAQKGDERVSDLADAKLRADERVEQAEKDVKAAQAQRDEAVHKAQEHEKAVHQLEMGLENAKGTLETAQREIKRLQGELAEAREKAGQTDAVASLQGQLAQMQDFLSGLDERSAGVDEATMTALMEQLSQRETTSTQGLEQRFNESLDASLDKITKTMERATAKPIDVVVEATDVLVDKLFDGDYAMTTNLDELEVEKRTSRKGIAGSLAALKKMRGSAGKQPEEKGGDDEGDAASKDKKKKMDASVERLKAVRSAKGKK